jgi:hypothetical protein
LRGGCGGCGKAKIGYVAAEFLLSALVTLFVVVDPVGLAPTFLAVTEGLPPSARRRVAAERNRPDPLMPAQGQAGIQAQI